MAVRPGSGKTAWIVNELLKIQQHETRLKKQNPKHLLVHGIRDLKLPHEPIFCESELCDICRSQTMPENALLVNDWPKWKQKNDLIVVDEVQRIWRPRTSATKPPPEISMLETHRHYGVDFWLISQGPHLFDTFIRALVGRHIHLLANWAGRQQYEWPECKQNLASRTDAVKRPYSLPKRVYSLYKSAEVHTKLEKRKPLAVYGLIGALIVGAVLIGLIYNRLYGRSPTDMPVAVPEQTHDDALASIQTVNQPTNKTFPDFKPTLPGVPESAPAYSNLVQVKSVPLLVGCVKSVTACKCYTAQATLYKTSPEFCDQVIAGNYFNPYVSPVRQLPAKPKTEPESKSEPKQPEQTRFPVYQTVDNSDIASH